MENSTEAASNFFELRGHLMRNEFLKFKTIEAVGVLLILSVDIGNQVWLSRGKKPGF